MQRKDGGSNLNPVGEGFCPRASALEPRRARSTAIKAYTTSIFVLLLDQLSKYLIRQMMEVGESLPESPLLGIFRLVHVENRGIAFGILSSNPFLLTVLTAAVVIALIVLIQHSFRHQVPSVPLSLICGGALGNLMDRLVKGQVTDFIDLSLRGHHWPAFNIADTAITVGVAILLWDLLIRARKKA